MYVYICVKKMNHDILEVTHIAIPLMTKSVPVNVLGDVGSPSNQPNSVVKRKVRELVIGTARVMSACPMVV